MRVCCLALDILCITLQETSESRLEPVVQIAVFVRLFDRVLLVDLSTARHVLIFSGALADGPLQLDNQVGTFGGLMTSPESIS